MYDAFLVPKPKNYECITHFWFQSRKKLNVLRFFGPKAEKKSKVLRFFGAKSWKCDSAAVFCFQNQKNTEIYGKREKQIP